MEHNEIFHKRFKLKKLIGRGAFAEVWLADDNYSNIEVALKIFVPKQDISDYGARLLASEFAVVANLSHENLLRPIYYDNCDGKPYLVLPYCERGSCVKMMGKLSEYEAWNLLKDVASGLAYLHSHKPKPIIHQDVKPDNILIGSNGQYMLSDFGVSDQTLMSAKKGNEDQPAMEAGISSYRGPEFYSKDKVSLKASDIYSLGATMYELLTGELPFGELGGLMQVHGCEVPDLPRHFSERLNYVVKSCLDKDTWQRPTAEILERWALSEGFDIPQFSRKVEYDNPTIYESHKTYDNNYYIEHHEPRYEEQPKRRTGLWVTIISSVVVATCVAIVLLITQDKEKPSDNFIDDYQSTSITKSGVADESEKEEPSSSTQKENTTKQSNKIEDIYESDSYKDFEKHKNKGRQQGRSKKHNEKRNSELLDNFERNRTEREKIMKDEKNYNTNRIIDLDKGES